ncbi:MAG: outer membrane beta-barrel protein [Balneolaceae bacterium]
MKKLTITSVTFLFILPLFFAVHAQYDRSDRYYDDERLWGLGVSYEIRSENPTTGLGIRFERDMVPPESVFKLGMRAHFSYFNESTSVTEDEVTLDRDFESYDFGLALLAGVEVALAKPYIGIGVGTENFSLDSENPDDNFDENNFFWNAFGGLELAILPSLRPFLEYRITRFTGTDELDFDDVNRVAVGLTFRF